MSNNKRIGDKIKEARRIKNITQKELGNLIGKAESSIQKYESGKVQIPIEVLEKIATNLETDIFALMSITVNELMLDAEKALEDEIIGLFYSVGYEVTQLESGDFEILNNERKFGKITATREELNELHMDLLDYFSYTANDFFNKKREEKFKR